MWLWGSVVVATWLVVTAGPARAIFHQAVIDELMLGCGGDSTMQYVQIRTLASGQNVVGGSRLTAFSCDGSVVRQLALVGSNIANDTAGARWIIASASFQTAAGIAPDFATLNGDQGMFPNCGQVCWGKPPSGQEDNPGNYVDCVAYGPYSAVTTSAPTSSTPNTGAQSLTRVGGAAFDNDFTLATPAPTNSMTEVGDLGACTAVTSTTTSTGVTTSSSTSTTTSGGGTTTSTTTGPALRGGGPAKTDCFAEWRVAGATGTKPVVTCKDNDPTCDSSATAGCVVRAQLCFNDAAASIYGGKCTASPVTAFTLGGKLDASAAGAIANALTGLPGAEGASFSPALSALTCTEPIDFAVPLRVKGTKIKKGALAIKSVAIAGKKDKDKLKLVCVP